MRVSIGKRHEVAQRVGAARVGLARVPQVVVDVASRQVSRARRAPRSSEQHDDGDDRDAGSANPDASIVHGRRPSVSRPQAASGRDRRRVHRGVVLEPERDAESTPARARSDRGRRPARRGEHQRGRHGQRDERLALAAHVDAAQPRERRIAEQQEQARGERRPPWRCRTRRPSTIEQPRDQRRRRRDRRPATTDSCGHTRQSAA